MLQIKNTKTNNSTQQINLQRNKQTAVFLYINNYNYFGENEKQHVSVCNLELSNYSHIPFAQ